MTKIQDYISSLELQVENLTKKNVEQRKDIKYLKSLIEILTKKRNEISNDNRIVQWLPK